MAETYVVTAPYVVPKVRDANGAWVHRGYYRDAVIRVEDIDPDSLRHHIEGDMMAERDAPAPVEAAPEPVVESDQPARPKVNDPKDAWVAFAAAQRPEGQSEADARTEAEAMSKADLITTFGG
jgi:hypothetical protein